MLLVILDTCSFLGWHTAQCLHQCGRQLASVSFAELSAAQSPPRPPSRLPQAHRTPPPLPHLSVDLHVRWKMVDDLFEFSSLLPFPLLLQAYALCFSDPGSHLWTRQRMGSFGEETRCFFWKRTKKMKRRTKRMRKICLVEHGRKIGTATLDS